MMSGAKKRAPKRRFKEFLNAGDWEQCKLDELTISIGDGLHGTPKYDENGSYYFINGNNLVDSKVSVTAETKKVAFEALSNDDRRLDSTSILMSINGTIGTLARYNNENIMLGKSVAYITPKNINRDFLFYQLQGNVIQSYFYKNLTGTTIKNLGLGTIKNAIVMSTLSEEESKIGQFFYKLDQFITLHQRKLDKLQATKKALLQEMFPEEGQDKPKRRFKGFTDAWEQRKLGNIVDFLDGQRKPLKESERTKGKYPYYGASGIIDYINDYLFDENLVLLSEDGANIIDRNYPVCFIATGKYWVNNHAHVLKVKTGVIDKFICESLERLDYTKFNTGTAQPKLNQDICQKIVITIPNEDEQKCISEFLDRINNIITLHQHKLDKLKNLKQAYLNEMFV